MVEENTTHVKQREKEISLIVQSITDLNDIFKDLASMVVDQVLKFSRGSPGTSECQIFSCPPKNFVVPKSCISKAEFFYYLQLTI